ISHDLLSVAALCHRIAILHEGRILECGTTESIFDSPSNSYTRRLIAAIPDRPGCDRLALPEALLCINSCTTGALDSGFWLTTTPRSIDSHKRSPPARFSSILLRAPGGMGPMRNVRVACLCILVLFLS